MTNLSIISPLALARRPLSHIRNWMLKKIEVAIVGIVTWALSKCSVQEAIVHGFTNRSTPMCEALADAAEHAAEEAIRNQTSSITADDIDGLESAFENFIRDHHVVEAEDIRDLDDYLEKALEGFMEDHEEQMTEAVLKAIGSRLRA
jgi:hypothetical protein